MHGFILFLISGLIIFFGAHYFLYRSILIFFRIANFNAKNILIILLIILPISFFISSIFAHYYENLITRIYYVISVVWLGALVNLILAAIIIWLSIGFGKMINYKADTRFLSILLFSMAIIWLIYGLWNAANPQVKIVDIKIKNLPQEWKNKTIVQLSDLHLGYINGAEFLDNIVNKVNEINPDLVVITGDLFDGTDGALASAVGPLSRLKAKNGSYFITGNHETYLGINKVLPILKEANIKILNNEMVEMDGLQLIGIDYSAKNIGEIIKSQRNFNSEKFSILLYHSPIHIKEAKENGIDLQLSGHTHKGQIFPFGYITKMIYNGYDYGLKTEGDFNIYTTNGAGTWGPPIRTGNKPEIAVIRLK